MKKIIVSIVLLLVLTALVPYVVSQSSNDADISVSVDRKCQATSYNFQFSSGQRSEIGFPFVGTGGTGFFVYQPTNQGEMAYIKEDIDIYKINVTTAEEIEKMNVSSPPQTVPYKSNYTLNSTNRNADANISRVRAEDERAINLTYWYDGNYSNWENGWPERVKTREFIASTNYTAGYYRADLNLGYSCEFKASESSTIYNASSGNAFEIGDETYSGSEALNLSVDGINASVIDGSDSYVRSAQLNDLSEAYFQVVTVEGNGSTPEDISDINNEIGRNLETDADQVSNFTKNSSISRDVNRSTNASRNTNANTTSDFEQNASLDSDTERTEDSSPVEGDNDQAGQTPEPEPEPQPEPEPVPLLSLSIRPLNSSYEAPRGRFTEIGLEIENIGEETVNNVELEPRYSEGMNWEAQIGNIDSLAVGDSINRSVYVSPGEDVSPGTYQIPVYASNQESDIDMQYVNVEVLQEVFRGTLNIQEAPRDVRFERNSNYTVPVLLQNQGEDSIQNVQVEVENSEACGEYAVDSVDSIAAGESASVSVQFTTGADITECSGTIVASSDNGDLAFSEFNMDVKEEVGPIPEEFRVPIVASLWTVMLLAYAVLTKKYGVHNMTVKIPLVLLVVGEAFIVIYLSSVYYNVMPPGLLHF